jgi:hypothetical protein
MKINNQDVNYKYGLLKNVDKCIKDFQLDVYFQTSKIK